LSGQYRCLSFLELAWFIAEFVEELYSFPLLSIITVSVAKAVEELVSLFPSPLFVKLVIFLKAFNSFHLNLLSIAHLIMASLYLSLYFLMAFITYYCSLMMASIALTLLMS
jgi:hypothetical protein